MNSQEGQNPAVMMIEFGVTRQPESYQSVRCSVSLPVFVEPGDDVHALLHHRPVAVAVEGPGQDVVGEVHVEDLLERRLQDGIVDGDDPS